MKTLLSAVLVAVPLLALPASARAEGGAIVCFGFSCTKCNDLCGNGCGPAAPWYTYWPLAAQFQTPAMPSFPYWPSPMTTTLAPPPVAPVVYPAAYSPIGGYAQWPSYWYGH